jgi:hypothetical protein
VTLSATGYASDQYQKTNEGFEFEQSVTRYVGLVGRATAYQVYSGDGYDTPFKNNKPGVRNFGRFEGGIDLIPFQGTNLVVFGGGDVGSSQGAVVDGRFSTWILLHTLKPINLSFDGAHYYHNGLSGGRVDLQMVTLSTDQMAVLAGVGGAIWGGGPEQSNGQQSINGPPTPRNILHGQCGPDISAFVMPLHVRIDLQIGYGGDQHTYGLLSISRTFGWDE